MSETPKTSSKKIYLFILIITFINLLQAFFTEITLDEAYYYQYARDLDWGYYDHPPMVALVIKISQLFFNGNLGVRFLTVLLFSGNLFLIWKYLLPQDKASYVNEFIILSLGLVMMNAYSFITTPDVPLLFFGTVFFILYQRFTEKQNFWNAVLLGISVALLFYSKYQAVLLVFFVVISNLKMLTKPYIYLAGIITSLLMIPHLMWHIEHNFPTFQYHLVDRSEDFEFIYFLEYLPNQFAVFNPFILIPFVILLFKNKYQNLQEKAYYFVSVGFLVFFALTSLRGHVEPHWTVIASIPMLILFLQFIKEKPSWKKYVRTYVLGSIFLVFLARVVILTNLLPKTLEFTGKKQKYEALAKKIGKTPVLFTGSFQSTSLYNYFTGNESSTLGSLNVKKTQFDIWQREQNYFGKRVFVEKPESPKAIKLLDKEHISFNGFYVEHFQTPNRLKIEFELPSEQLKNNQIIPITIYNPTKNVVNFNHPEIPVTITAVFLAHRETTDIPTEIEKMPTVLKPGESFKTQIKINTQNLKAGHYNFGITTNCILGNAYNSKFVKATVN
ncbi:MAG: glycosyltransferase family 39 protein [Cloacibacterium sp.]|uniref:ArnT family glycosyltransferase n=1 Tax=Cloacibacterium sp. TaxID=1913682 RepID=UPI003C7338AC